MTGNSYGIKHAEAKIVQNIFEPIAHFHDIETNKTAQKKVVASHAVGTIK